MGRGGTGIQSFPAEDLRKRTRYLKFPLVVVLRTFLSQKRLFCIDPRGRAVDRRRRSGDSPERAGSKGKRERKERKKEEKRKRKRRGGTSRHSTTFSSCCLKPGLESIVQSKRERVLVEEVSPREESSSEVLRRTPWALPRGT